MKMFCPRHTDEAPMTSYEIIGEAKNWPNSDVFDNVLAVLIDHAPEVAKEKIADALGCDYKEP